jgi:tRNA/rRNA methyltransferase
MRIPTREEHRSVNLGQAVAICLYELARDGKAARAGPREKQEAATAGETERINAVLLEALRTSGYLAPRAAAATEEKIRRLVRRFELSDEDAKVWLGMLRQIVWKLKTGKGEAG